MRNSLQIRIDKFGDWVKGSNAYRAYRQSALYDNVQSHSRALKRLARLPRYVGREYQCPICGIGLRAFRPMRKSYWGDIKKFEWIYHPSRMETFNAAAAYCPGCNASDRERLTALYLDETFRAFDRQRTYSLIEFAPNEALSKMIKRHSIIAYRSADLSRKDVDERIDLTAMENYPDGSVDGILCSHILEHIPDDRAAMREICRVLRPDGFAVILVPLVVGVDETHEDPMIKTEALRWKYFGLGDHVRQYGKRDFLDRLAAAGLRVEQLGIEHFGAQVLRRAGVAANSVLYVAHPGK
jgi:SAM-dependent methyltransferase